MTALFEDSSLCQKPSPKFFFLMNCFEHRRSVIRQTPSPFLQFSIWKFFCVSATIGTIVKG